jgi:hypothetical protein
MQIGRPIMTSIFWMKSQARLARQSAAFIYSAFREIIEQEETVSGAYSAAFSSAFKGSGFSF